MRASAYIGFLPDSAVLVCHKSTSPCTDITHNICIRNYIWRTSADEIFFSLVFFGCNFHFSTNWIVCRRTRFCGDVFSHPHSLTHSSHPTTLCLCIYARVFLSSPSCPCPLSELNRWLKHTLIDNMLCAFSHSLLSSSSSSLGSCMCQYIHFHRHSCRLIQIYLFIFGGAPLMYHGERRECLAEPLNTYVVAYVLHQMPATKFSFLWDLPFFRFNTQNQRQRERKRKIDPIQRRTRMLIGMGWMEMKT